MNRLNRMAFLELKRRSLLVSFAVTLLAFDLKDVAAVEKELDRILRLSTPFERRITHMAIVYAVDRAIAASRRDEVTP